MANNNKLMSIYDDFIPLARPLEQKSNQVPIVSSYTLPVHSVPLNYLSDLPVPLQEGSEEACPQIYQGSRAVSSSQIGVDNSKVFDTDLFITPSLRFDSSFESGNLDQVFRLDEYEYDLYMRSDTNTNGHLHWFYFSVSNIASKQTIRFNLVNFSRSSSLYKEGMKIRAYSSHKATQGIGWEHSGFNIKFSQSKINTMSEYKTRTFYQLSFDYYFAHIEDTVWFATTIPYSYTRMLKLIRDLSQESDAQVSILTKSVCRKEVPLLTIPKNEPKEKRKYILVTGRVHPSETVGSWVVEGFLKFLCSNHPDAVHLRNTYVIKVVPMINVDGVIAGNSRTGMSGDDLNRFYDEPDPEQHPEICAIRKLVQEIIGKGKLSIFIDIHGHFCKKGSFMYGPHFPMHSIQHFKCKIIPKLLGERTEIFRFYSSTFEEEKYKMGAARVVLANEFAVKKSYTLENSYFGYIDSHRNTHCFTIEDLCLVGENLGKSISEYSVIVKQENYVQAFRAKNRRKEQINRKTHITTRFKRFDDYIDYTQSEDQKKSESENSGSEEDKVESSLPPLEIKGFTPGRFNHKRYQRKSVNNEVFIYKNSERKSSIVGKIENTANYTITEFASIDTSPVQSKRNSFQCFMKYNLPKTQRNNEKNSQEEPIFNLYVPKNYNKQATPLPRIPRLPKRCWNLSM